MQEQTNFRISKSNNQGVSCLYLDGQLDAHTAPELEQAITDLIEAGDNQILVNFKDLQYISSAGLGVFMAFIEDLRENDGDIKMSNMNPKVYSVFDLLGFPVLFDIVDNEDDAIGKFIKS